MRAETNDKIVLISNFTSTLDLFQKLCDSKRCVVALSCPHHPLNVELTPSSSPAASAGSASMAP